MKKVCPNCRTVFTPKKYNIARGGGKYCSATCYRSGPKFANQKGEKSPFWKGDNAAIGAIHDYLKSVKGSAKKCEHPHCLGDSQTYDWALIKGRKYEDRNTDDYWQLCRKCHKAYDFIESHHKRDNKGVFI